MSKKNFQVLICNASTSSHSDTFQFVPLFRLFFVIMTNCTSINSTHDNMCVILILSQIPRHYPFLITARFFVRDNFPLNMQVRARDMNSSHHYSYSFTHSKQHCMNIALNKPCLLFLFFFLLFVYLLSALPGFLCKVIKSSLFFVYIITVIVSLFLFFHYCAQNGLLMCLFTIIFMSWGYNQKH